MTWGQLRFSLQAGAPGVSLDLIDSYLQSRYEQVLGFKDWSGLNSHATIVTTAAYQSATDTVALAAGSVAVTGTGTSWTRALVGMKFFRPGDTVVYRVSSVLGSTVLELDRPYEGEDATGAAYVLMQNVYRLPNDCSSVIEALNPISGYPLADFDKEAADQSWGPRTLINDPQAWAPADDSDEQTPPVYRQIEFFPPPLHARGIPIEYRRAALPFDGGNTGASPLPWVPNTLLLEGVKADLANYLKDYDGAAQHEAKFEMLLSRLALADESENKRPRRLKMAPRFSRHRVARVLRGQYRIWGPGQGGPN